MSRIEDAARAYVARVDDAGECNARPEYRALRDAVRESMRDEFLDKHCLDDTELNDPEPDPDPVATALAELGEAAVAVWLEPYSSERAGELRFAIDAYARARKGER